MEMKLTMAIEAGNGTLSPWDSPDTFDSVTSASETAKSRSIAMLEPEIKELEHIQTQLHSKLLELNSKALPKGVVVGVFKQQKRDEIRELKASLCDKVNAIREGVDNASIDKVALWQILGETR